MKALSCIPFCESSGDIGASAADRAQRGARADLIYLRSVAGSVNPRLRVGISDVRGIDPDLFYTEGGFQKGQIFEKKDVDSNPDHFSPTTYSPYVCAGVTYRLGAVEQILGFELEDGRHGDDLFTSCDMVEAVEAAHSPVVAPDLTGQGTILYGDGE